MQAEELDFKREVQDFFLSFRPVSLREEQYHRIQRWFAGGNDAKARAETYQRALSVVHSVKKQFEVRSGRSLDKAPVPVQDAFAKATASSKKSRWRRPKQMGSALFFYMGSRRKSHPNKEFTNQELVAEWKALSSEAKRWWQSKHQTSVHIRRNQCRMAAAAQKPPQEFSTAWGLGNDSWPLKPELLQAFLSNFRGKQAGMQALQQDVQGDAVQTYLEDLTHERSKYHFKDALRAHCNDYFGGSIGGQDAQDPLVKDIMLSAPPAFGCYVQHPGLCKSTHGPVIVAGVQAFFRTVPKKSGLLRFKSGSLVVFARAVLGQVGKIMKGQC